jgi:hypothetical protein
VSKIHSWGFVAEKTISLIKTLTPWVILSSFDGSAGDEGYGPKDEF